MKLSLEKKPLSRRKLQETDPMNIDGWNFMHNWDLVLPPSRPSALQLNRIKTQIQNIDRSVPVAILGSTPEFRDLLFQCGFQEIYLLERNLEFLDEMSSLRAYRNKEHVIEGHWLTTLPNLTGKFAAILSDLTSGNIPYDQRSLFYDLIAGALMNGGLFCDKVLTHPIPHIPLSFLIDKYAELPLNLLYANQFSCEVLFCSNLLDIKEMVDSSQFYSHLEDRVTHERVRAFIEYAKKITPPGCIWWYGRKWSDLQVDYCKQLVELDSANDETGSPYYGRLRFFEFAKG